MDLSFAIHKLEKFSSNPGKLHFEGLVHLLRYIRDNNTLGLNYDYATDGTKIVFYYFMLMTVSIGILLKLLENCSWIP